MCACVYVELVYVCMCACGTDVCVYVDDGIIIITSYVSYVAIL